MARWKIEIHIIYVKESFALLNITVEVVPADDGTHSAPITFMEFTTLNKVRGMIGNVMRSVPEEFMEL